MSVGEYLRCEDCRWWDNSVQHGDAQPDTTGACRVNPPTAHPLIGKAFWPFTEDTDWCGNLVRRKPAAELPDDDLRL